MEPNKYISVQYYNKSGQTIFYRDTKYNFILYQPDVKLICIIGRLSNDTLQVHNLTEDDRKLAMDMISDMPDITLQFNDNITLNNIITISSMVQQQSNMCQMMSIEGDDKGRYCGNQVSKESKYCGFHADIDARQSAKHRFETWVYRIIPRSEHCHLGYKDFPKDQYDEYNAWCENHDETSFDDGDDDKMIELITANNLLQQALIERNRICRLYYDNLYPNQGCIIDHLMTTSSNTEAMLSSIINNNNKINNL